MCRSGARPPSERRVTATKDALQPYRMGAERKGVQLTKLPLFSGRVRSKLSALPSGKG